MISIVAVAHDPGGANVVGAAVLALLARGVAVRTLAQGPACRQLARLGIPFDVTDDAARAIGPSVDLVLCGTSQEACFELDASIAARSAQVPSVALIDYWSGYRLRFEREGRGAVIPDHLVAIDDECRDGMVADGLPPDRIRVVGQPFFAWLLRRRAALPAGRGAAVVAGEEHVLFVSEPGEAAEAAAALVGRVLERRPGARLMVRFHPRETDRPRILRALGSMADRMVVDAVEDSLASVSAADVVIGVTSTILAEAALLGRPALRIADGPGPFERRGLTATVADEVALAEALAGLRRPQPSEDFLSFHAEADRRVAELCVTVAQTGASHTVRSDVRSCS